MTKRADEFLAEAAATFKERNAVYGDNWQQVGDALQALFPKGIGLVCAEDWNRMHILMLVIVKLTRYANNWNEGGHADSIHDAMVYCGMLQAIDAGINEKLKRAEEALNKVEAEEMAEAVRDGRISPATAREKMQHLFCDTCDRKETCATTMRCQQKSRMTGIWHVD